MSESRAPFFEPSFNRSLKVRSRDSRLTSDAGAVLLREADEILDSVASLSRRLYDPRRPDRIRYTLEELLRERIYGLALGYRVADDLDHLAHDPAMRIATWVGVGDRVVDERLASQPTQSRLIDYLSGWKSNVESVREAAVDLVANHIRASGRGHGVLRATLDVDSFPVVARGLQAGSEYNGHYHGRVFHPLVAGFAPNGIYDSDRVGGGFVHAILRGGSAASQQGALRFIRNAVKKCRQFGTSLDVRVDAAFTKGWIIDGLTDDRIRFVGRLADNPRLERLASEYVYRPVGRPPSEGYEYTVELGSYQAESWCHPQRVVLVVVDKPDPRTGQLNLFPYHFFLVTNWKECDMSSEQLLAHYRQRGTFEDRLGEFSQFVSANLSSPKFEENEVILLLSLLAFNLVTALRSELEEHTGNGWDLGRFQATVPKTGGRIIKGQRRLFLEIAQAAHPLWSRIIRRIKRWRHACELKPRRLPRRRRWMPPPKHAHLSVVLRT